MKALLYALAAAAFCGLSYSTSDSKTKIVALRDALDEILDANQVEARTSEIACPFHACTAKTMGCKELKYVNGCPTCECVVPAEVDPAFGVNPVVVGCPKLPCADTMKCGRAGLKKDERGCDTCECAFLEKQPRASTTVDKGACQLVPERGPCKGRHVRYYYDRSHNRCMKFLYGGCNGNSNNFETEEECSSTCGAPSTKVEKQPRASDTVNRGACQLVPERGPCKGSHQRYYYDRSHNRCMKFIYGGCNGNSNNFETIEECSSTCGLISQKAPEPAPAVPCPAHACTAEMLGCAEGTPLKTNDNGCSLCECEVEGNVISPVACTYHACTAEMLGCANGLAKNTQGCELCECAAADAQARASDTVNRGACQLVPERGPCKGSHERYYYDRSHNRCMKFIYGGCNGNSNNFETLEECSKACGLISMKAPEAPQAVPCPLHGCTPEILGCATGTQLKTNANGCSLCECEVEGTVIEGVGCPYHACTAEILGCLNGLARNAHGCELCECAAADVQARASSTVNRGACQLVPEPGPCMALHERYYYDRSHNRCMKFLYGGCNGNSNNFETLEECSRTCGLISLKAPEAPQAVPCPLHGCTPEILGCATGTQLKTNANGCSLCECEVEGTVIEGVGCPYHACTAEILGCLNGLARNAHGCELCECAAAEVQARAPSSVNKGACMLMPEQGPCYGIHIRYYYNRASHSCETFLYGGCSGNSNNFETKKECSVTCGVTSAKAPQESQPAPCLMHGCTPEILGCAEGTGLKTNDYGCTLCECEVEGNVIEEKPVACPLHSCTAEMLECQNGLAKNEAGCDLCECAGEQAVGCPFHACTAEMLGCTMGLARNEAGCELCECAGEGGNAIEETAELSKCEAERAEAEKLEGLVQDGPFKPRCDEDGSYAAQQCYYDQCWCVDRVSGEEISGTRVSNAHMESMTCHQESGHQAQAKPPPPKPLQRRLAAREAVIRREVEKALRNMQN